MMPSHTHIQRHTETHTASSFIKEVLGLIVEVVFIKVKPLFSMVYVKVNTPFFVTGDDRVRKSFLKSTSPLVTSKQILWWSVEICCLVQSVWNTCVEVLKFPHCMKVIYYIFLININIQSILESNEADFYEKGCSVDLHQT